MFLKSDKPNPEEFDELDDEELLLELLEEEEEDEVEEEEDDEEDDELEADVEVELDVELLEAEEVDVELLDEEELDAFKAGSRMISSSQELVPVENRHAITASRAGVSLFFNLDLFIIYF
jgi:vacuolar-type H+-ATPase subunit I/STV1